jgi:hypothetical protein
MDYLQFTASLVGSLAWPAVVAFLLFLLRKQLVALVARIITAKLPGGIEFAFSEGLVETEAIVQDLAKKKGIEKPEDSILHQRFRPLQFERWLSTAFQNPESAVLTAFKEVEDLINSYGSRMPHRKSAATRINWLAHKGIIDEEMKELFFELRNLKLIPAAGRGEITAEQAAAYVEQCRFLLKVLRAALEKHFPPSENAG